jgi:hypothetical protein
MWILYGPPINCSDLTWQLSDPEKCDQMYESLARINTNIYRERVSIPLYPYWYCIGFNVETFIS